MSDAKRTPYRQPETASSPRARGAVVRQPDEEPKLFAKRPEAASDPDAGVFSGLLAPHPASSGAERVAQIVLTAIGLPLIVATFVTIGWLDTRHAYDRVVRRGQSAPRPLGIAHPFTWIVGAGLLALLGFAAGVPWPIAALGIGVPFAALFARRAVRRGIAARAALLSHLRERRAQR